MSAPAASVVPAAFQYNFESAYASRFRTNVAAAAPGKLGFQVYDCNLLTVRHNFSRAEQLNRTFDVPTREASANGRETNKSNSFIK